MEKALIVIGTRSEAIKFAPVLKAMRGEFEPVVCSTGQHHSLVAQAMASFDIKADIALDDKDMDMPYNALLALLISQIDSAIEDCTPDWVAVLGDSTSALAGGLAAFHRQTRLVHVEAGLRTGDFAQPYPEETNRILLSKLATLNFAPTRVAQQNLLHEGVRPDSIVVSGNTIVDAMAQARIALTRERRIRFDRSLPLDTRPIVIFSAHRTENRGEAYIDICLALQELCELYPRHHWVFPVFPEPEIQEIVYRLLRGTPGLTLLSPLGYHEMLHLMERAVLLVTDSGTMQEEAPSFGLPAVILRDHTERPESIGAGCATLAGRTPRAIIEAASSWLDHPERKDALSRKNPYGDGGASHRIVTSMLRATREAS